MTANQIRRVIPSQKQALSDAELIDLVQRRQTFLYFFGTGCIHRAALRAIEEGSIRIQRMMQSRSAVQVLASWPSSSQGKRMDCAGGRRSASCAHARSPRARDLPPRTFSAPYEWSQWRHRAVQPKGRWRRISSRPRFFFRDCCEAAAGSSSTSAKRSTSSRQVAFMSATRAATIDPPSP